MKCQKAEDCASTVDDLNNRKDAQFKTELKDGKLKVVGEVDINKLSKSERALYNAIVSTTTTATLEVVSSSDSIQFGYSALNNLRPISGLNQIDRSDLNELNKVNPALAGEVVAHEAMEAYAAAGGISSFQLAHIFANQFFGNVNVSDITGVPAGASTVSGAQMTYEFRRIAEKVTVERTFVTPQPAESLPNALDKVGGRIRVIAPGQDQKPNQEKKPMIKCVSKLAIVWAIINLSLYSPWAQSIHCRRRISLLKALLSPTKRIIDTA